MFIVKATSPDGIVDIIKTAYLVSKEQEGHVVKYTAECECCGQTEHKTRWYSSHWTLDFDPNIRSTGR